MRTRGLLVSVVAVLALPPAGAAAPPVVSATADVVRGAAPLGVTLTATGDADSYRWELGDGAVADGAVVSHVYAEPGAYVAVVTATSAGGETARAEVAITASRVTLRLPAAPAVGTRAVVRGAIVPAVASAPVQVVDGAGRVLATARTGPAGGFSATVAVGRPAGLRARVAGIESAPALLTVRPRLDARVAGARLVGRPLRLLARTVPSGAGRLVVQVRRGGKLVATRRAGASVTLPLDTRAAGELRISVALEPGEGYAQAAPRRLSATVAPPLLVQGSRGPAVLALERRLAELRYALPRVDGVYDRQTTEAVLAFQKVQRLPWTGRVDARVWRALDAARTPMPRHAGTHIEVSKGRQYLLVVERGRVTAVVHVSTGATGNTPIGTWRIYRKVAGWDWVLWYPMYFLRGFAIHGYPEVPAYPASHGCVRVPMWIAPRLYAGHGYGQTIHVYW